MGKIKADTAGLSMVVLAGGKSSRMGNDKSDLQLGDQTFLECQIQKGRQLGIIDILVSGYKGNACSAPVVRDRVADRGPLGGLEACFRQAREEQVLVLGVDVPLVPVSELTALIEKSRESRKAATILQHRGKQEPLIGVYRRNLADAMLEELSVGKGSVFAVLRRVGYDIYESCEADSCFMNINRPADYAALSCYPSDHQSENARARL